MLQIDGLTLRVGARALLDDASATIAEGWKVGLIGRNGAGKSTLLRAIQDAVSGADEAIRIRRGASLGFVAQELAATQTPLLQAVVEADGELVRLRREALEGSPDIMAAAHARLLDIGAHAAEARAAAILSGLGFSQDDLARPTSAFSGGWRMRGALAGVLFATPDLLILDEPTNYLDLEGASWLEAYLKRYPNTVLMVSHDREMLNRSVTHILALEGGKLELSAGGYDLYLKRRADRAAGLAARKAKQDAERAHLQAFVDRFRAKASKARQAQSRVKMLERMTQITVPIEERTTPFRFDAPAALSSPIVELEDAALGYGPQAVILNQVSLRFDQDDRVGIIGANGQGKTTLVKAVAGRLALQGGARRAVKNVTIGYFSQDQLDELRPQESVLDHIRALEPAAGAGQLRALAARFGFGPEKVETKTAALSGGEKVRLLLGLIAHRRPHLLILDEPTSHLDVDSREALILALNDYDGAVLLITHDVYLAEATVDRLVLVNQGRARAYDGDLADYRALVLAADRDGPTARDKPSAPAAGSAAPAARARVNPQALARQVRDAEAAIAALERRIAAIDSALDHGALFASDPARAGALADERAEAVEALGQAEERWLTASDALSAR
jgi:ATP-binding cassette, subfamily F, member 3